jgi:DNA-3-methyladenine glycosylase I
MSEDPVVGDAVVGDLAVDEKGVARCRWGASTPEYQGYHDNEWGLPVGDDTRVFEKLCLEGFQAGLSWLTILRKREAFRTAFASFDPRVVARFDDDDIARLLGDSGIIRHRGKIVATIANAQATVRLAEQGISLAAFVWGYEPATRPAPKTVSDIPAWTAESKALSGELRRRGFRFVGQTTAYAAMQSLGLVNDHLVGCHSRATTELARAHFEVPELSGADQPGAQVSAREGVRNR